MPTSSNLVRRYFLIGTNINSNKLAMVFDVCILNNQLIVKSSVTELTNKFVILTILFLQCIIDWFWQSIYRSLMGV